MGMYAGALVREGDVVCVCLYVCEETKKIGMGRAIYPFETVVSLLGLRPSQVP